MRKITVLFLSLLLCILCGCKLGDVEPKEEQIARLETEKKQLKRMNDELQSQYDELQKDYDKLQKQLNNGDTQQPGEYRTDITYENLNRQPDIYENEMFILSGTVFQTQEEEGIYMMTLAIDDNSDNLLFCTYMDDATDMRILENDRVKIYATSTNLISYESLAGTQVTVPSCSVEKIELEK